MTQQFIGLWCEFDYGQENMIFDNEDDAMAWLWDKAVAIDGVEYLNNIMDLHEAKDIFFQCLASYRLVTLWEPSK